MNIFARIISHGFGLLVVAILALGLIYRGDLFPGLELPEFLVFERALDSNADSSTGTASSDVPVESVLEAAAEGVGEQEVTENVPVGGEQPADIAPAAADDASEQQPNDAPAQSVLEAAAGGVGEQTDTESVPVGGEQPADTAPAAADDASVQLPVDEAMTAPLAAVPDANAAAAGNTVDAGSVPAAPAGTVADAAITTQSAPEDARVAADEVLAPLVSEDVAEAMPATTSGSGDPQGADGGKAVPQTATETSPADAALSPGKKSAVIKPPAVTNTGGGVQAESPYRQLAAAREAYWLRDYATAEKNYQALIDSDPDNPDGYGELGNMYFSQGKWTLASAAYFEAGKRLADEGLVDQARQLVDVLKGLQGPQSGELEKYINAATSTIQ